MMIRTAMNELKKTLKGFSVGRRCDICGRRAVIVVDTGELCLLQCATCGREYRFFHEEKKICPKTSLSNTDSMTELED